MFNTYMKNEMQKNKNMENIREFIRNDHVTCTLWTQNE
jgi:hypothetical protein